MQAVRRCIVQVSTGRQIVRILPFPMATAMRVRRTTPLGVSVSRWLGLVLGLSLAGGCVGDDLAGPGRVPASLTKVMGDSQQVTVGTTAALPLLVEVTDTRGTPMSGVLVYFTVDTAGGSVLPNVVTTGPDGRAQSAWTVPTSVGIHHATVSASGLDSISFSATVRAGAPAQLILLRGDSQQVYAGLKLDSAIVVEVRDSFANPVTGVSVVFAVSPGQGTIRVPSLLTDGAGRASASWVIADTLGPLTGSATAAGVAPLIFTAFGQSIPAAPAARLALGEVRSCLIRPDATLSCFGANDYGELGAVVAGDQYQPVPGGHGMQFVSIVANFYATCGITPAGETWCFGYDGYLGTPTPTGGQSAVPVAGLHQFVALSGGDAHTCGLEADGSVWCWGENTFGQLGAGFTSSLETTPVQVVGGHRFQRLVAGGSGHTCALTRGGTAWCWGRNNFLQVSPDGIDKSAPVRVNNAPIFTSLAAGEGWTCAIAVDGAANCWGNLLSYGPTLRVPSPVSGGLHFLGLAGGAHHVCGFVLGGEAYCWGRDDNGAVGTGVGYAADYSTPVSLGTSIDFTEMAAAGTHSCGLTGNGTTFCWGDNARGQAGVGVAMVSSTPVDVLGGVTYASLAVGDMHSCALQVDGAASCWGRNDLGAVDVSALSDLPAVAPTPTQSSLRFVQVAAGAEISCGLLADGSARCWGVEIQGSLGDGGNRYYPGQQTTVLAPPLVDLAAGGLNGCGTASSGGTYCWGVGFTLLPGAITGADSLHAVTMGLDFACGLRSDSLAVCWGGNGAGQLGDASTTARADARPVSGGLRFGALTAGNGHVCGVTVNGEVWCWGENTHGQVSPNDPVTFIFTQPIQLQSSEVFAQVGAGDVSSCAVTTAGATWCWGGGNFNAPLLVPGGAVFVEVHLGREHACGRTATGRILCWGSRRTGQLGDGFFSAVLRPQLVQ